VRPARHDGYRVQREPGRRHRRANRRGQRRGRKLLQLTLRNPLSLLLVLLGGLALLAGAVAAYARLDLLDEQNFADRAVESLEGEGVRRAIERELVGALPEAATPRQRRLIESVTDEVIRSDAFRALFREATVELHTLYLGGDDQVSLRLDAAIPLVEDALPANAPALVGFARRQLDGEVLTLRRGTFEGDAVARTEDARTLGVVLPLLALVLFVAALLLAVPRRRALLWIGITTAVAGGLIAASVPLTRALVLDQVEATGVLSAEQVRTAAGEVYDAFVGDLLGWGLVLALVGALMAGAGLEARGGRRRALG
jgi:hypothetical protein